jgi:cytoskeletal protein CcmA (bactofilin family)
MAANVSIIGRGTKVQGRVSGAVDLEVRGFVDGEIAVGGDVTVEEHGLVGASVHARKLVVRGAVKGDLTGEESVVLEDGARVVGDVRAPRVTIAPGALVRGYVETGAAGAHPARTTRAQPAARPAPAPAAKVAPAPKPAAKAAPAATPASAAQNGQPRRPPPPVVPALKKAKGQVARKRER